MTVYYRYDESEWGWKDRDKLEEMTDSRAWYLLGREQEGNPVAFIHFRFDMEDTEEVLYWSGFFAFQIIHNINFCQLKFSPRTLIPMRHFYNKILPKISPL